MLYYIYNYIYTFEFFVFIAILFILLCAVFRLCSKSPYFLTRNKITQTPANNKKRRPPQESRGELECKRILEKIFRRPFYKVRPDFLRNEVTGGKCNMELDLYCRDLALAVEYDGKQHAVFIPFFHKNKEAFYNQKYRDELKRRMCKDHGITLISVPHNLKIEHIEGYLTNRLYKLGYIRGK